MAAVTTLHVLPTFAAPPVGEHGNVNAKVRSPSVPDSVSDAPFTLSVMRRVTRACSSPA